MANQFGEKIRRLRESSRLFLREVASQLEIDTPMLSKIERGERKAKKEQIKLLAKILKTSKDDLLTLWLADQVIEILQYEDLALKAMQVAEEEVRFNFKKKVNISDGI